MSAIGMSALYRKETFWLALGGTFAAFIDLQSCPRGLAVPEQAVAVPSSEPGQVSKRVFSTLPF